MTGEVKVVKPKEDRFWQHVRTPISLSADISASATGVGSCGDMMRVDLRIEKHTIVEIRCEPKGCGYTVACASALGALTQGLTIDKALELRPEDVADELEYLPEDHLHCARLAINTLGEAIAEYYRTHFNSAKFNPAGPKTKK